MKRANVVVATLYGVLTFMAVVLALSSMTAGKAQADGTPVPLSDMWCCYSCEGYDPVDAYYGHLMLPPPPNPPQPICVPDAMEPCTPDEAYDPCGHPPTEK
jgi:hypothetical protein